MANFSVHRSDKDTIVVLSLEGFLDAHTAPEFESALQRELDGGHLQVVVDGSGLSYISSAGLGVFMGSIEDVRERGGDIKICALSPKVRQVFEMLGFDQLFDILEDASAAQERFAEAPTREV